MKWVLFFDGDCGFCNKSVRWAHWLDRKGCLDFSPLQGKLSEKMGFARYAEKGGGSLVLLREADGAVFLRSDAWIEMGRVYGGFFRLAGLLRLVPRVLRDGLYRWIAANRYRFAGSVESCVMPDERLIARMRE